MQWKNSKIWRGQGVTLSGAYPQDQNLNFQKRW